MYFSQLIAQVSIEVSLYRVDDIIKFHEFDENLLVENITNTYI